MCSPDAGSPLPHDFTGQRATIVGLAREGTALARYLARHGALVTVTDIKPASALADEIAALGDAAFALALGGHPPRVLDADVIYVSPGVPPDVPLLAEARRQSIRLSSVTEVFLASCRAPIIGVTGSSGKTTTSTLAGEILERSGWRTWVGGNIGRPLIEHLDEITTDDRVVLELSSFQLEGLAISPQVAVVLNLTPDHLDRHPTFEAYRDAKLSILTGQQTGDAAVLNADDPETRAMAAHTTGRVLWFSMAGEPDGDGGFEREGRLVIRLAGQETPICDVAEVTLRGRHNLANILAACLADTAVGGQPSAMAETARSFVGVPHRLEIVGQVADRLFVNDSIATSPERSMAAIRAFDRPIVLLAGGRHKHLPLVDWARLVRNRVRHLVLFGEAAAELEAAVGLADPAPCPAPGPAVHRADSLESAVRLALAVAPAGAVVLLSPACTSFDAFSDYVERGTRFREAVARLAAHAG